MSQYALYGMLTVVLGVVGALTAMHTINPDLITYAVTTVLGFLVGLHVPAPLTQTVVSK